MSTYLPYLHLQVGMRPPHLHLQVSTYPPHPHLRSSGPPTSLSRVLPLTYGVDRRTCMVLIWCWSTPRGTSTNRTDFRAQSTYNLLPRVPTYVWSKFQERLTLSLCRPGLDCSAPYEALSRSGLDLRPNAYL